jgi:hypothetical protein
VTKGRSAHRRARGGWFARHRTEILLALLVLAIVGPVVQKDAAQQASRYALTAAVFEEHTFVLDDYIETLGVDKAFFDGHWYSDKAPGQPLLAVPFYAMYRWVGGEPGTVLRVEGNLGLWWLTFWFTMLPAAGLSVLMYRMARRVAPKSALAASLGLTLGTMMLPFSTLLFAHVFVAFLALWGFSLVVDRPSTGRTAFAGALMGLAVFSEYTMAIAAVIVGIYVLLRSGRKVLAYVLGGLPSAALLLIYNRFVFGSPFVLSYQLSAFNGTVEAPMSVGTIFGRLNLERLFEVFLSPRGFAVASPIVLLALLGLVVMIRRRSSRAEGVVSAAMFLGFLMVPLMWGNAWGGDSPGPRYMLAALPFLAAPLALMWRRLPLVSTLAFVLGALTMGLATFTDPLISRQIAYPLTKWLSLAWHGDWATTLFTMWLGTWGWLVQALLVGALALELRRCSAGHLARRA